MTDCVFCGLLDDGQARWVAQESAAVAFLPLPASELAPGHTLVVSRAHVVGVLDADLESLTAVAALIKRVGHAMQQALGATGINVLNASGPHSGQSVDHLHFHVVPRWPGDAPDDWLWPSTRSTRVLTAEPHLLLAAALPSTAPAAPSSLAAIAPTSKGRSANGR